jgi:hypothetical protein
LRGETLIWSFRNAPPLPPPWSAEPIPGGYVVKDATGQALAYVYARETKAKADTARMLKMDEATRIAAYIAKLPEPLEAIIEAPSAIPDIG